MEKDNINRTWYEKYVQDRTYFAYLRGLISRYLAHIRYERIANIARRKGAIIGEGVIMPKSLAKKLNSNVIIGNHVSIESDKIDTRAKLIIGNNVIIGRDVEIITVSHNIESPDWEPKYYGLEVQDYVWIATKAMVLPSCRIIGMGGGNCGWQHCGKKCRADVCCFWKSCERIQEKGMFAYIFTCRKITSWRL